MGVSEQNNIPESSTVHKTVRWPEKPIAIATTSEISRVHAGLRARRKKRIWDPSRLPSASRPNWEATIKGSEDYHDTGSTQPRFRCRMLRPRLKPLLRKTIPSPMLLLNPEHQRCIPNLLRQPYKPARATQETMRRTCKRTQEETDKRGEPVRGLNPEGQSGYQSPQHQTNYFRADILDTRPGGVKLQRYPAEAAHSTHITGIAKITTSGARIPITAPVTIGPQREVRNLEIFDTLSSFIPLFLFPGEQRNSKEPSVSHEGQRYNVTSAPQVRIRMMRNPHHARNDSCSETDGIHNVTSL